VAIGGGVILAQLLMSPPTSELAELAGYFALSGALTIGGGWLALRTADRNLSLSILGKTFLGGIIASAAALLNVLVIAGLMFVSTGHDLKLLICLTLFSAVATASLSFWVARSVAGRLDIIASAVKSLAGGDLKARAGVAGDDEVSRLAADVNALGRRLQEAEDEREALDRERRELTTAISHDLRTPLASLRAMVEALDDGLIEGAEITRYYGVMRREIDRLSRMIDDLFELARIDAGALPLKRELISVEEIAADVVDAMQPQALLNSVSVELQSSEPANANLDGARMERAIANLVRNAIQHTPSGGRIAVAVERENGWIDVRVSDDGEGIDPVDLPHIWDRFYRAEKSRYRGVGDGVGAGLGLAIVRGIVEAHGGNVAAQSSPDGGSVFTLRLPSA
jgi:signal transduction histidine kinase